MSIGSHKSLIDTRPWQGRSGGDIHAELPAIRDQLLRRNTGQVVCWSASNPMFRHLELKPIIEKTGTSIVIAQYDLYPELKKVKTSAEHWNGHP